MLHNHRCWCQSEPWLDEQRIGDQSAEASEVRRGIERIGIAAVRQGEPALKQRSLGRHDEEQGPNRQNQQPRHPQERIGGRRGKEGQKPDRQRQSCNDGAARGMLPPDVAPGSRPSQWA